MSVHDILKARIMACLRYEPETGMFYWAKPMNRRIRVGSVAGSLGPDGYVRIRIDGKNYLAQRLAFVFMTGNWPAPEADHRDQNPANNRWLNLREATRSLNNHNRVSARAERGLLSGIQERSNGRFTARIKLEGRTKCLGTYDQPEEANAVYVAAKSVANKLGDEVELS